jgi:hypothetical protein
MTRHYTPRSSRGKYRLLPDPSPSRLLVSYVPGQAVKRPGAFPGLEDGHQVLPGHITSDGVLHRGPIPGAVQRKERPSACTAATSRPMAHRNAAILASNGSHHHGQLFAGSAEPTIPGTQPELSFPSDIAHRLRQAFDAGSQ